MSFWNKIKDLVGIDDDNYYDDEYDNDEEVTDEDISNLRNLDEEEIEEKLSSYDNQKNSVNDVKNNYASSNYNSVNNNYKSRINEKTYKGKVNMTVTIREPLNYEDGKEVMDDILNGKVVVLNLEMLEIDKKTQVFYFVSGGVYSLNGSIQNVTKDIYVLVPEGVEIDGKLEEKIKEKSIYQI